MFLEIEFKDGAIERYPQDYYTDYEYRNSVFVIKKNNQWIGIYDMGSIRAIRCYAPGQEPIFD